jgi:hypothetical protein
MELIERYLQAIGQYLPADSRNDILAELRTELLEQMDARAEEWGRPLDEADAAAILKVHGRPEAIASRYLPQRWLIGPSVFPFYMITLRRSLPLVLLAYAVANAATLMFSAQEGDLAGRIWRAVFGFVPTLFMFWGIVTIVFAVIDYAGTKSAARAHLERWDPLKMPALKPQQSVKQRSVATRVLELAVHVLWMLYVLIIPAHPFLILGPGAGVLHSMGIGLAPVWHPFFVLLIVMLSVQLLVKILALRFGGQVLMKPLDFVANLIGIGALSLLAFGRQVIVSSSPTANLQQLATINHAISLALRIALLLAVFGLISEIWKYLRERVHLRSRLAV